MDVHPFINIGGTCPPVPYGSTPLLADTAQRCGVDTCRPTITSVLNVIRLSDWPPVKIPQNALQLCFIQT